MQRNGKLENSKAAYAYRPTYPQLGRLRAFIDHSVDYNPFADVIWGDSEPEMEEQEATDQLRPGQPDPNEGSGGQEPEEPAGLTTAELFDSNTPGAVAARALLQAVEPAPKMEDSEDSFHDTRDEEVPEPGAPATVLAAEEYQPSLRDELLQRAADAVAAARQSPEPQRTFDQDVDYGEADSDL
eukprot:6017220-Amphidinium_carterae.1